MREAFLHHALSRLGCDVLWAHKGPDSFDCSGLVTWAYRQAGGVDWTLTHNTDRLYEVLQPVKAIDVMPGDLGFYFAPGLHAPAVGDVEHVVIMLADGRVLTADGATPQIRDYASALKAGALVQGRRSVHYRPRFAGYRRLPFPTP